MPIELEDTLIIEPPTKELPLTGRLINLFHKCDSTVRLDSIVLTDEVRALVNENDELKAANVALEEQLVQMHEGLTLVAAENIELKAELDQCLTAHAMLNDKVCANVALEEQLLQMHEELTLAATKINELKDQLVRGAWSDWTKYESYQMSCMKKKLTEASERIKELEG